MTDVRLSLDEELLAAIDEARGDVPRTRWLRRAVEAALEKPVPVSSGQKVRRAREVQGGYPALEDPKPLPTVDPGPAPGAKIRCAHPKDQRKVYGWGTMCGLCGEKVA